MRGAHVSTSTRPAAPAPNARTPALGPVGARQCHTAMVPSPRTCVADSQPQSWAPHRKTRTARAPPPPERSSIARGAGAAAAIAADTPPRPHRRSCGGSCPRRETAAPVRVRPGHECIFDRRYSTYPGELVIAK